MVFHIQISQRESILVVLENIDELSPTAYNELNLAIGKHGKGRKFLSQKKNRTRTTKLIKTKSLKGENKFCTINICKLKQGGNRRNCTISEALGN